MFLFLLFLPSTLPSFLSLLFGSSVLYLVSVMYLFSNSNWFLRPDPLPRLVRCQNPTPCLTQRNINKRSQPRSCSETSIQGRFKGDSNPSRSRPLDATLSPIRVWHERNDHPPAPLLHGHRIRQRRPNVGLYHFSWKT